MSTKRESYEPLVKLVPEFMRLGRQTTQGKNVEQMGLYIGLQLEEMREKLVAVQAGCITPSQAAAFDQIIFLMKVVSDSFKSQAHYGAVLRANPADLVDADFDIAWVGLAGIFSTAHDPLGVVGHGAYTNMDKFRDGKAIVDASGKIRKPADWQAPDFWPYVSA